MTEEQRAVLRQAMEPMERALGQFTRTFWASAGLLLAEPGSKAIAEVELPEGRGRLRFTAQVVVPEPPPEPSAKA